jgi:hypothetical protein
MSAGVENGEDGFESGEVKGRGRRHSEFRNLKIFLHNLNMDFRNLSWQVIGFHVLIHNLELFSLGYEDSFNPKPKWE